MPCCKSQNLLCNKTYLQLNFLSRSVPQGSVLKLFFFLVTLHFITIYADDTSLTLADKDTNSLNSNPKNGTESNPSVDKI